MDRNLSSAGSREPIVSVGSIPEVFLAQDGQTCHAILDTGASRCVIGEKTWQLLLRQLPDKIQSQVRRLDSRVSFRFGNNQSLTSVCKMQIPLANSVTGRKLWLSIEVVPGSTPFLFSKRAFKQLGGILDTTRDVCILQRLSKTLSLTLSKTELYLIDMLQLCHHPDRSARITQNLEKSFCHVGESKPPGVIDGFVMKHADPSQIEVVSLSEAQSASEHQSSRVESVSPSVPVRHAAEPHVDRHQDSVGSRDGHSHTPSSSDGAAVGSPEQQSRGRSREPSRGTANYGEHGPGAATSKRSAAGFANEYANFRSKSTERRSSKCSSSDHCNSPSSAAASVNNSLVAEAFRQAQLVPVNRDFDQQSRGGHSTRTWAFVEESEEELIMEAPRRGGSTMTARPPPVNQVNRSAAARLLIEWGQSPITWGKKHRGKTFLQVLRDDPGYYAWSLARLASLPPPQQDFVRFCQEQLEADRDNQ